MTNKEMYRKAWAEGAEGRSRTAPIILDELSKKLDKEMRILDLGCGDGFITFSLIDKGFEYTQGVDITLEGVNTYQPDVFAEAPLDTLPYNNKEFDFTFSVDVLEHIPPELVEATIREILRVTKTKTYHCIATFPDNRRGYSFHPSCHPITWWAEQFKKYNTKGVEVELIDRTTFLQLHIPNYKGK